MGQKGLDLGQVVAFGQVHIQAQVELGHGYREVTLEPGLHVDQIGQLHVLPAQGQFQPPIDLGNRQGLARLLRLYIELAQGLLVLQIRQIDFGQHELDVQRRALQGQRPYVEHGHRDGDAGRLKTHTHVQRHDAARHGVGQQHAGQRGVLPAGAHLDAKLQRLVIAAQIDRLRRFKIRQVANGRADHAQVHRGQREFDGSGLGIDERLDQCVEAFGQHVFQAEFGERKTQPLAGEVVDRHVKLDRHAKDQALDLGLGECVIARNDLDGFE